MCLQPTTPKQMAKPRVNQCLEGYLRCMCRTKPKSWHKWLSLAQRWYNSSHHSAINKSPFEAVFGYKPLLIPTQSSATTTMATVG